MFQQTNRQLSPNIPRKIFLVNARNIKIFLAAFFISLPFWWGINILEKNLEDFFFWKMTQDIYLKAQISQPLADLSTFKPIRNWKIENLNLNAKSAISVEITKDNNFKVLFEKAVEEPLPIASLTKLMTAYIVFENHYNLSDTIEITQEMVDQEGKTENLEPGQIFRIEDLLYMSLIESSNDAAYALASGYGEITPEVFVNLMNIMAEELGLEHTHFVNPTGLDPDHPEDPINYSTAKDLSRFAQFLLTKPLILDISATPELDSYLADGTFHHHIENTNILLRENLKWSDSIVGGKTGWTPEARGCLLLILKSPKPDSFLVNVVLGSEDRFGEMKELTDWVLTAYRW